MSSFSAVVQAAVTSAVQTTSSKVLTERGQKLLHDITNVVEAAAEDTAKLGASTIIKTEDCVIDALKPREIERSILNSIIPPKRSVEMECATPSSGQYRTVQSLDTIDRGATPPRLTRRYLTKRRPSVDGRRLLNETYERYLADLSADPTNIETRTFLANNLDEPEAARPMHSRFAIGVCSKPLSSREPYRPKRSGYLPLEKFSKKPMPNKRFDGFMTEPRRPRTLPKEEGAMSARTFVHRTGGLGQVSTPVKTHPENIMVDSNTLTTSTISIEDNNLYPCPQGVVIFPAPKLLFSQDVVTTPPVTTKTEVYRKPKID